MYWTLELASKLEDAPWPATKDELIDYAMRSGAPMEVIENLQEMEDEGEIYESIEDIWPDYPSKEDFFFNEEEYCSGKIYSEQHRRNFDVKDDVLRVENDPDDESRLNLTINRKPIADWFIEQWQRLRYGTRLPQPEEKQRIQIVR